MTNPFLKAAYDAGAAQALHDMTKTALLAGTMGALSAGEDRRLAGAAMGELVGEPSGAIAGLGGAGLGALLGKGRGALAGGLAGYLTGAGIGGYAGGQSVRKPEVRPILSQLGSELKGHAQDAYDSGTERLKALLEQGRDRYEDLAG